MSSDGFNVKSLIVPGLAFAAIGLLVMGSSNEAKAAEPDDVKPDGKKDPVTPPPGTPPGKEQTVKDDNGIYPTQDGSPWGTPGKQSNSKYQWKWPVKKGDNPSVIAKKVTGNDRRFVELIAANPSKAVVGNALNPYSSGYNFASLAPGERLLIPRAWNIYIDETGSIGAGKEWPV